MNKTKQKKWYDYLWIWSIVYFSLGFFNILFAWLGMIDFIVPLLFAIIGGNKNFCNKLDSFIDDYYSKNKNSGYLRVTLKDEIIYERNIGYADIENKVEFTKDSIFTFYSMSKPFCAIKILIEIPAGPAPITAIFIPFFSGVSISQLAIYFPERYCSTL